MHGYREEEIDPLLDTITNMLRETDRPGFQEKEEIRRRVVWAGGHGVRGGCRRLTLVILDEKGEPKHGITAPRTGGR
jgi:hypothetical protein